MEVESEEFGREWCNANGFDFISVDLDDFQRFVLCYDDGNIEGMSFEEEQYYLKKLADLNEIWVIASEDGINSTMYKGLNKSYTFRLADAKKYTKLDAQKTAAIMTKRSKVGRVWFGLRIK